MPPRSVPRGYLLRRLAPDAGAIVGMTFTILGAVFLPVGISLALTAGGAIAWVFVPLGIAFFTIGLALLIWRVSAALRRRSILRDGQAALGRVESVTRDYSVEINGRSPLVIGYSFRVMGRDFQGKVSTLREPDGNLRSGAPVYVLFNSDRPEENILYLDL